MSAARQPAPSIIQRTINGANEGALVNRGTGRASLGESGSRSRFDAAVEELAQFEGQKTSRDRRRTMSGNTTAPLVIVS